MAVCGLWFLRRCCLRGVSNGVRDQRRAPGNVGGGRVPLVLAAIPVSGRRCMTDVPVPLVGQQEGLCLPSIVQCCHGGRRVRDSFGDSGPGPTLRFQLRLVLGPKSAQQVRVVFSMWTLMTWWGCGSHRRNIGKDRSQSVTLCPGTPNRSLLLWQLRGPCLAGNRPSGK